MKELAAMLVREVPSEKAVNCLTRTKHFGGTVVHNSVGSRWELTFALRTRIRRKRRLQCTFQVKFSFVHVPLATQSGS